ncbi:MAG: Trigger factor [Holosporales bacterium]
MEIQKQSHENLVSKYLLTIDKNAIEESVTFLLEQRAKTYKKPGFRPGKVPVAMIEKEFGAHLRSDAMNREIQSAVNKILEEKPMKLLRQPQLTSSKTQEDGKIEITLTFEEMPQFELKDISDLKIRKLSTSITDTDVENFIAKMRRFSGTFEDVQRSIEPNDFVTVKFTVTKDSKIVNEIENEEDRIDMVDPAFEHKNVAEMIVGKNIGDKVTVTQPYKHLDEEDRNVDIAYEIIKIESCTPCELNDDFFKTAGVKDLEQLKAAFNASLKNASDRMSYLYSKRQLLDQLSQQYDFEVPSTIVEQEEKNIRKKIETEKFEELVGGITEEDLKILSTRRIQLGLVIGRIATEHNISVPPEMIVNAMYGMAEKNNAENPSKVVEAWVKEQDIVDFFRTQLIEGVVVDHLIEKATTENISLSIKEFYEEISEYLPSELYDLDSFDQMMNDDQEDEENEENTLIA